MDRPLNTHAPEASVLATRLTAALCLACGALLWACNTTEGVGKDVKSLGKGIEETAQDSKPN